VRAGLTATPKELPPKWFYDERGSELFADIMQLPEYYPTDREREILDRYAVAMARHPVDTFIELGAGSAEKTRVLLDAFLAHSRLRRYVPFDVSEDFLRSVASGLDADYPELEVHGVVGDFEHHLGLLPGGRPRMIGLMGGTIGNFLPAERKRFLSQIAELLGPGDGFLLGTDLVKDPARLVAAYDDSGGVTAAFNKNVLNVINRDLGADFVADRFEHVARWDGANEWIEMHLRATEAHVVRVAGLDLEVPFAAGEEMRTEVSAKFRRLGLVAELADAGLELLQWWTDAAGDFAVALSHRLPPGSGTRNGAERAPFLVPELS
jgi:L-histidine N-alpha-methyltransferase